MEENVDRKEGFVGSFGPPLVTGSAVLLDGDISFGQDAHTRRYAAFAAGSGSALLLQRC